MPIKLYNEDCFDVISRIIKWGKKVDHVISDIPYNIQYDKWDNNFDTDYLAELLDEFVEEDGNIILFSGWSNACNLIEGMNRYFDLKQWVIWDRIKGNGINSNRKLISTREDILWFSKSNNPTFHKAYSNIDKKTKGIGEKNGVSKRALTNVWTDISPVVPWSKEYNKHPTQKPLELMERIVNIWTNEGDTVCDVTMGSGTTGVACVGLNRKFIGMEIDEEWFKFSEKRIRDKIYVRRSEIRYAPK